MAVKLNRTGFENAKELIRKGEVVDDERGQWSSHQPRTREQNELLGDRGMEEYGKWHLAVDDMRGVNSKGRYKFLIGDFQTVHACALRAAESQAGQYADAEIERAIT